MDIYNIKNNICKYLHKAGNQKSQPSLINKTSVLSGKFLNEHPELHKFQDFKFDDNGVYHCKRNKQGIITDITEF